ncbi:MAG: urease accessory protein UreD [Verrucomicrobiales bacterium]|nr:urease accessory protein UreD [Verrucomicrobiales bacterium]
MSLSPPAASGSLQSDVGIEFRHDDDRERTILTRRKAGGLCHIGKPYWNDPVLSLQLVNPTAGLFANDELTLSVDVGDHAKVALTSPSASRYHTMPRGRAELNQRFTLGNGSWLDYWPEITIPHRDSDVRQNTVIRLEADSSMVFLDTLAPGRIAHGENQQFRRLETILEIHRDGEQLVRERCVLEPGSPHGNWQLSVPGWEVCYYAAIWISGSETDTAKAVANAAKIAEAEGEDYHGGASLLHPRLAVVRLVANSSLILRRLTTQLRKQISTDLPLLKTDFRKI